MGEKAASGSRHYEAECVGAHIDRECLRSDATAHLEQWWDIEFDSEYTLEPSRYVVESVDLSCCRLWED